MGPPGSGKSTQATLLSREKDLPHISTGKIFREIKGEHSELGRKVSEYLKAGEFVPDSIVQEILEKELAKEKYSEGFVLDGYPRNLWQTQNAPFEPDKVFYLEVSDGESVERLFKRGRADDTEEIIRKRLADYHERTEPVLDFYQQEGKLEKIDGERSVEEIFADALTHV
jgi:adenylate kinase